MWVNAQRDGRPAEYRWRPLFNAAVWLTPSNRCRAVTLPMPNLMAALPNLGGALCSTPQSLADAQYWSAVQ